MNPGPGDAASAGSPERAARPSPRPWAPRRPLWRSLALVLALHLPLLYWSAHWTVRPRRALPETVVNLPPLPLPPSRVVVAAGKPVAHRPAVVLHRRPPVLPARDMAPPPVSDRWRLTEIPGEAAPDMAPAAAAEGPPDGPGGTVAAAAALPLPPVVAVSEMAPPPPPAPPTPEELALQRLAGLPVQGEVDYRVTKGTGEWRSGRGTLRWQVEGGRYRLDLDAHAEGLPALFWWSPVHWSSEGRITPAGLQPDLFMKGKHTGVRFDWGAHTLTFLPSGFVRPLPAGGLDLLSVFFQFALRPPNDDGMDFPVTNGDKIDRYAFERTDRAHLQLELGDLDTVHISRVHKLAENGFEIWLAQDRNFLPVQMRLYHARLGVLNLYATGIRVSGLHGRLQEP